MYISIKPPPLELHCEHCDGPRNFLGEDEGIQLRDVASLYLKYVCANCRTFEKTFSIHLSVHDDRAEAYKYGEMPPFGVAVPNRLLKILGKQRDNFLKGRRSENQGLGVGAFSYYRRVVKNQKNEILDEMIVISRKQGASSETLARWKMQRPRHNLARPLRTKARTVGLDSNQQPQSSHLLHSALSAGVHEHTDERCLELAQAVRLVLVELAERLTQALRDEHELNNAVSRLLKAREPSD